jgi:hypothetical protein
LFKLIALGNKESKVASSVAGCLARLDKRLTKDDRDMLTGLAGGTDLGEIGHRIIEALDPDEQLVATGAAGRDPNDETAVATVPSTMITEALEPLTSNPDLRSAIIDVRRSYEQTIDKVSKDEVLFAVVVRRVHRGTQGRHPRLAGPLQPPLQDPVDLYGREGNLPEPSAATQTVDSREAVARVRDARPV